MKFKKTLFVATALALIVTASACGGKNVITKDVYTGIGGIVSLSKDSTTGSIKSVDITTCAASFDIDGVIIAAQFDVIQVPVLITTVKVDNVDTKKAILNPTAKQTKDAGPKVVESKQELLERYGMKSSSTLGLEAYQQLRNLADFVKGKTMAQVIGRDEHALEGKVSITTNDLFAALMEAYEKKNAPVTVPNTSILSTGVGIVTTTSSIKNDTGTEFDIYIAAVTIDQMNVIYGNYIDTFQVQIVASVVDTNDVAVLNSPTTLKQTANAGYRVVESKKELGSRYGMYYKNTSGVLSLGTGHGEWFEQANKLEKWTYGKKVSDLNVTLTDTFHFQTNHPLASSVTITVDKYLEVIKEAATYAKALPMPTT